LTRQTQNLCPKSNTTPSQIFSVEPLNLKQNGEIKSEYCENIQLDPQNIQANNAAVKRPSKIRRHRPGDLIGAPVAVVHVLIVGGTSNRNIPRQQASRLGGGMAMQIF
jgi:hypothetical protein